MALAGGTVTLLFTDIEGSTRLLDRLGERYAETLGDHRRLLRAAFEGCGGVEVDTQGDAFFVAFARARDAVHAAVAAQRALAAHPWPLRAVLRVRMGIHTGEPSRTGDGYVGIDVHRGARICAAGHGGQILLSAATCALVGDAGEEGITLRDVGEHRLKDLPAPEHLFQVVTGDLPTEFPPLKSLDNRPTNLPAQLTALVGRRGELAQLARLLDDEVRLVTLTGPGGSGKSRLSLEVAGDWREAHSGWTFLVPLAPVNDPSLVGSAIVDALGLRDDGGEPVGSLLMRHLRAQRALLLLDNFEHLLDAGGLVAELLAGCPQLKVLVTSRVPLHLSGEHEFEVLPLPTDDAVALFLQRARASGAHARPDGAADAAVAEICRRLDGLPLAIELAAARSKLLSPAALLQRLEAPLALLTGGPRDRPERQQTIRATIDWSYRLLALDEQRALASLSVFAGGFSIEAAEEVSGASLDVLVALVDASLVRRRELEDGETRLSMLETIRQYAAEQLHASGRTDDVGRRHAELFLQMARDGLAQPWGPRFQAALTRTDREHDNLRAALAWALERDPALAVALAGELVWFWDTHGHLAEGRRWLQAALERGDGAPADARARACFAVVRLASTQWQHDRSTAEAADEALRLYRELDDAAGEALTLSHVALGQEIAGDLDAAIATSRQALSIARTRPEDRWTLSVTLNNVGVELIAAHQLPGAQALLEESLALRRSMGDKRGMAVTLENLTEIALGEGDLERAGAISDECAAAAREIGFRPVLARTAIYDGIVALLGDAHGAANVRLSGALEIAADIGDGQSVCDALKAISALAARGGAPAAALRLWVAGDRAAGYSPAYDHLLRRLLDDAEAAATARERDAARADGEALSTGEAIDLARKTLREGTLAISSKAASPA